MYMQEKKNSLSQGWAPLFIIQTQVVIYEISHIIIFQASIQSHIKFWVLYCFSWQSYKCTHNLLNSVVKPVTTKYQSLVPMSVLVCFSVTMIKHCPRPACWRKGVSQLAGYNSPLEKTEARSQGRRWSRV